jgi:ferredoxin-NADP reductase
VKIEADGAAGTWFQQHLRPGDTLDVSSPRGSFILQSGERPLVLLSAGIGATPVLAMLHALADAHSIRRVLWLHAARDGQHHPFAAEVRRLMLGLPNGRSYVCYSRPDTHGQPGREFDAAGRLSPSAFVEAGVSKEADVYLCGPPRFMADMKAGLAEVGVAPERIHVEIFNRSSSLLQ